jgi:hypothetical protein
VDDAQLVKLYGPVSESANAARRLCGHERDSQFIADANKVDAELQIGSGEEVQRAVEHTLNVPEPVSQRARAIFAR